MNAEYVLVVGGADTGKTHYGTQLMLRLEKQDSQAHYFEPPTSIEPFREAMKSLNLGKSADHTVGTTIKETTLPLEFPDGYRARTVWPDYAGEQLRKLVRDRHAGTTWAERARTSDAWLLFVRHDHFKESRDLLNRPVMTWTACRKTPTEPIDWMPQAQHIEMLQMLLFLRKASCRVPLRCPRLGIVLSCWDTFPEQKAFERPEEALHAFAPLLADFIESNWHRTARFVVALSALGKPLDKVKGDEEFVDRGPAAHGWVIKPDGQRSADLTWPLVQLARMQ